MTHQNGQIEHLEMIKRLTRLLGSLKELFWFKSFKLESYTKICDVEILLEPSLWQFGIERCCYSP